MNRLQELFQRKKNNILNVYCTAGFPQLDSTITIMRALQDNGAEIIELGMPYSDPLADGPVIQASNTRALQNGMTMEKLFAQLQDCRKEIYLIRHVQRFWRPYSGRIDCIVLVLA